MTLLYTSAYSKPNRVITFATSFQTSVDVDLKREKTIIYKDQVYDVIKPHWFKELLARIFNRELEYGIEHNQPMSMFRELAMVIGEIEERSFIMGDSK